MRTMATAMAVLSLAACAGAQGGSVTPRGGAVASMGTAQGASAGTVILADVDGGTRVRARLTGLPPGPHAMHVHAVGRCEGPAFTSAGGHFNPGQRQHGTANPAGPHAGDLPTIIVRTDGTADTTLVVRDPVLAGGVLAALDADGAAIMIHAAPDDDRTDPTGNAGARIACGVLGVTR